MNAVLLVLLFELPRHSIAAQPLFFLERRCLCVAILATGAFEKGANFRAPAVVENVLMVGSLLLSDTCCHGRFPIGAHFLYALRVVCFCVVLLAYTTYAFPKGEMLRVNGHAVILIRLSSSDECPAAFLLLQVQPGGIWEEEIGDEGANEAEPWDDVETRLDFDVVVQDGSQQSSKLSTRCRESVGRCTYRCGKDLCCDQEGDAIGSELAEERGDEIHGLEFVNTSCSRVIAVVERRNNKAKEAADETDDLHPLAAVQFIVDQERGKVVSNKLDTNIGQIPKPVRCDARRIWIQDSDKLGLKELVAIEKYVVGELRQR